MKGSSITIVDWVTTDGLRYLSLFYQDPELHLRDCLHDFSANTWDFGEPVLEMRSHLFTHHIVLGNFNPGVQPHRTPISAEVVREGGVELNVMWRDAHGRVVSSSWSKSLGWDLPNHTNDGNELLGRPARSVYIVLDDKKHLKWRGSLRDRRLGFNGSVDDGGKEVPLLLPWTHRNPGKVLMGPFVLEPSEKPLPCIYTNLFPERSKDTYPNVLYLDGLVSNDITASAMAINDIAAVSDRSNTGEFNPRPQTFIRDLVSMNSVFEHSNDTAISGGQFIQSTQQGDDGMSLCSFMWS